MATNWTGSWAGGRIATRRDGVEIHYLERMLLGRRVSVALEGSADDAKDELRRFTRDPAEWLKARGHATDPSAAAGVDARTVQLFLDHLKEGKRDLGYRQNTHHYLTLWSEWFAGRAIREVTSAQLATAIREWKNAKRHRIIALKSYCSFVRDELHRLTIGEDPSLSIKVPVAVAEKSVRVKGHTMEHVELIYGLVAEQDVRDVICLRALSGMHEREASRIATGKGIVLALPDTGCEIAGTVTFVHKSGDAHVQSLSAQALAATLRLTVRGRPIDNARQHREIRRAAELASAAATLEAGKPVVIPPLMPGELRHSFVTWARKAGREVKVAGTGLALDAIADAIGHKSKRTTSKFYDGTEVPPMIVVPLKLHHREDPVIPSAESPRSPAGKSDASVSTAAAMRPRAKGRASGARAQQRSSR